MIEQVVVDYYREERGMKLAGRKQRQAPPDGPFAHTDDCGIVRADPDARIEWSYVGDRRWERVCRCGREDWYAPAAPRARLDPLDPKTANHLPQCEFITVTDPAVLRVLLKVTDKGDYAWVECGSCEAGWQVPFYAGSIEARR
jgi:hypothetical protein